MENKLILALPLTALALAYTAMASAQSETRLLSEQRIFGDALGEAKTNTCTGQKKYFYNADKQLVRIVNEKRGTSSESFVTTDYILYHYADGRLADTKQWQYSLGEGEVWTMIPSATGNIVYTYDENGNCIEENDGGVITKYEYNADGFLTKVMEGSGRTIVYDEHTADGKPLHAIVRPARMQNLGDSYEAIYTYDNNGNLISILRQHDEDLQVEIGRIGSYVMYDEAFCGDFISEDAWVYSNGKLKEHIIYTVDYSGMDVKAPQSKMTYQYISGTSDIERYQESNYDAWTGMWTKNTSILFEDEYVTVGEIAACDIMAGEVSVASDGARTVTLTISAPEGTEGEQIVVYRNGEHIAPSAVSANGDGTFSITDSAPKTGDNEYFAVKAGSVIIGQTMTVDPDNVTTAITSTTTSATCAPAAAYDIAGRQISRQHHGITIIKTDGKVIKSLK